MSGRCSISSGREWLKPRFILRHLRRCLKDSVQTPRSPDRILRLLTLSGQPTPQRSGALERGLEAYGIAPRWGDGIAREQAGEVDYVEAVVQVFDVGSEAQGPRVLFPKIDAGRCVE